MRVLYGPRVDLGSDATAAAAVRALAGSDGDVVSLRQMGVRNLSRPITQAEVALLRKALGSRSGLVPDRDSEGSGDGIVVGYVCRGFGASAAVAVTDHVNLTWRSPLSGPNDHEVGPRFPSMAGIYAPDAVSQRVGAEGGIIVRAGLVAGVGDEGHLNAYESEALRRGRYSAFSSELVPVAIVAAHMGLRVAAAVLTSIDVEEEETGSGRS